MTPSLNNVGEFLNMPLKLNSPSNRYESFCLPLTPGNYNPIPVQNMSGYDIYQLTEAENNNNSYSLTGNIKMNSCGGKCSF